MTIGMRSARPLATADRWRPPLDYYLIRAPEAAADVEALVVEEFVRAADWTTVGLRGAVWTPSEPGWWSSAAHHRALRTDPGLRARVVPVDRAGAEATHRRLGGGPLPDETTLRDRFDDEQSFPVTTPLRLGPVEVPDGFADRRVYRVLFAGDPPTHRLPEVAAAPGRRQVGVDRFDWTLRRVGPGLAWSLDLTVLLAAAADHTVGPVLHELTSAVRRCGLLPVTTERFA
ncbi:hypothetical protein ACFOOK_11635 [Micromonospora krabiensis]|uniref:Uncharacterized protein n=1 Tax=Micromonospora krabiensis TaxID=307121 RepID=A0A1C3N2X0_9ACTN|nr:hypothetical protein [Micromonospora krabiensis]SBV26917.1 hypothetical protein GA0070620_2414 [Micromonospora krabiensis]